MCVCVCVFISVFQCGHAEPVTDGSSLSSPASGQDLPSSNSLANKFLPMSSGSPSAPGIPQLTTPPSIPMATHISSTGGAGKVN